MLMWLLVATTMAALSAKKWPWRPILRISLSIFSLRNTQNSDFLFIFWENCGHHKFVSLQYNTLVCWADGKNDWLTKRQMFQV